MNVHCGSDLLVSHQICSWQRISSRSGCCHLLLGGWRGKHQILGKNHLGKNVVIFCISPAQSTAQLEATHDREGYVPPNSSMLLQAVSCGMFIAPAKSGSALSEMSSQVNIGLFAGVTEHKVMDRNLCVVLINEGLEWLFEAGVSTMSHSLRTPSCLRTW